MATRPSGTASPAPARTNVKLYTDIDPLETAGFEKKVKLLEEMNAYARDKDPRVRQVSCSLAGEWQSVEIIRAGGENYRDIRPLVRLNVSVVVEENGRQESGSYRRRRARRLRDLSRSPDYWQAAVDEALRQALVNLDLGARAGRRDDGGAGPRLAGHPAARSHRPRAGRRFQPQEDHRAFAGLLGERVAAPGVTVVDDGTIDGRRGSLSIDDEGTPTSRTVLIEDGILKGYMQDRQNARLMGMAPTGNGRRQSYCQPVMPRMTNTYMLAGDKTPEEILASVKKGIYATQFRRRPGGHHQRQVRVLLHRGLSDRGRQGRRADQGRDPDRQRARMR